MKLFELVEIIDAEILVGHEQQNIEVKTAVSTDLFSNMLEFSRDATLLLTTVMNPLVVRIASILGINAIILVHGRIAPNDSIQLANQLNIPILSTKYASFEVSGRLYAHGINANVL